VTCEDKHNAKNLTQITAQHSTFVTNTICTKHLLVGYVAIEVEVNH